MYRQVKTFDPKRMGKRKGYCLQNCREGFGIGKGTFPSAKADMESQRSKGTLHDISSLPSNVAVPIYVDTTSKYEHVVVHTADGKYYEDGKEAKAPKKVFGWGEYCDGVRIIEKVSEPTPTPAPSHPVVDNAIVQAVLRGDYGNGTDRIYRLQAAGYDYNAVQAAVNRYLSSNQTPKYYTVQAGDNLTKIAKMYGTTVDAIARLNNIANKNLIIVGQRLRIA